jgi:ribosome-binding protein aMBF1 (putative translation factor)
MNMARRTRRSSRDAIAFLHRRYVQGRPKVEAMLREARLNAAIAQEIYDLRTRAGLTQRQLAELVGTTHSVISRLESADYQGHSLTMLQRVSTALNCRLEVRFVPVRAKRRKIA